MFDKRQVVFYLIIFLLIILYYKLKFYFIKLGFDLILQFNQTPLILESM
jgi:hypothetical protein